MQNGRNNLLILILIKKYNTIFQVTSNSKVELHICENGVFNEDIL